MHLNAVIQHIKKSPLMILLLFLPLAELGELLKWGEIWVFVFSALAVVPLAGLIGEGTEVLAKYSGPKIGGLINATLGNAAELIITIVAIKANLLELVKASITGSILGNLLFVLGMSMAFGGFKNGKQHFDKKQATHNNTLLVLMILTLTIPSLFSHTIELTSPLKVETLSLGVAGVMILIYILGLVFNLKNDSAPLTYPAPAIPRPKMNRWQAILLLAVATGGIVWMSELLVGSVEAVVAQFGLSEFFLGIILIPIIGNVAEHMVALSLAYRNQMDLSVEIAVSSSIQIALFVAPLLVFISLLIGNPLTLVFNQFELIALGAGIIITSLVASDGESNWLEGIALIAVYLILGFAFFLM